MSADRPGLHREPDADAALAEAMPRVRGGPGYAPRTSTRAPGSGSTTRWGRSNSPTSSAWTSVSTSVACCTRASAGSSSGRRRCSSGSSPKASSARRRGKASTATGDRPRWSVRRRPRSGGRAAPWVRSTTSDHDPVHRLDVERLCQQRDAVVVGELAQLRVQDVAAHEDEPDGELRSDAGDRVVDLRARHPGHPLIDKHGTRTVACASAPRRPRPGSRYRPRDPIRAATWSRNARIDGSSSTTSTRSREPEPSRSARPADSPIGDEPMLRPVAVSEPDGMPPIA